MMDTSSGFWATAGPAPARAAAAAISRSTRARRAGGSGEDMRSNLRRGDAATQVLTIRRPRGGVKRAGTAGVPTLSTPAGARVLAAGSVPFLDDVLVPGRDLDHQVRRPVGHALAGE